MSLFLAHDSNASTKVTDILPLQTKHSSLGEPQTIATYMFNDGKRANVINDVSPPPLIYTNIQIVLQGVAYVLAQSVISNLSANVLVFNSTVGWNIGTIIKFGAVERCRIDEIISGTSVKVTRNYTADGQGSGLLGHAINEIATAETLSVSLALPDPNDTTYNTIGAFLTGGSSLVSGLDPTVLTMAVDSLITSVIVKSNSANKYVVNSVIKIDNEQMSIVSISGNDITVTRAFNSTVRAYHAIGSIIYCVGIADYSPITHKFFVRNDPPAGLPTQKKKDIKVLIVADEEPL